MATLSPAARLRALGCLVVLGLAGCFSPSFDSGKLKCAQGTNECPPGYGCLGGLCFLDGQRSDGSAEGGDQGIPDLGVDSFVPLPAGAPCATGADCVTGICADTVCCDRACDGPCSSCNLSGSVGSCTAVARGGLSPAGHPSCMMDAQSTCKLDGRCDGAGGCSLWPQSTQCKPPQCNSSNQTVTAASTCDGKGVCLAPAAIPCAPYLCQDATQCWPACNTAMMAQQCMSPNTCVNNSCGKKGQGAVCSADSECLTGHCADGYCCNGACTGTCEACNLAATVGACTAVAGPAAHGTCPTGASSCGSACNGTNRAACVFPTTGAGCNDGNPCTYNDVCNGAGGCAGTAVSCPANTQCASYSCNGTATCAVSYGTGATACNDGNACTYNDVCNGAGGCAGTAVSCTSTSCTTSSCNGTATCTVTNNAKFTVCGTCHCGDLECDGLGTCSIRNGCSAGICP